MEGADTIVGIATALGAGGVAILRLSGSRARAFRAVFRSGAHRPPYESHRLMVGRLVDGDQVLDQVMGVVMRAPKATPGEDVCEIHTHGGHVAATLALRLLVRLGGPARGRRGSSPAGPF